MGRIRQPEEREKRRRALAAARARAAGKLCPSVLLRVQLVLNSLAWLMVCLIAAAVVVLLFVLLRR